MEEAALVEFSTLPVIWSAVVCPTFTRIVTSVLGSITADSSPFLSIEALKSVLSDLSLAAMSDALTKVMQVNIIRKAIIPDMNILNRFAFIQETS